MRYQMYGIGALVAGSLALGACRSGPTPAGITLEVTKIGEMESFDDDFTSGDFLLYARWFERQYLVTALQCTTTKRTLAAIRETITDALAQGNVVEVTLDGSDTPNTTPRICVQDLEIYIRDKEAPPPAEAPVGKK